MSIILSTNAGQPGTIDGVRGRTGIDKHPVDRLEVRDPGPREEGGRSGAQGDFIGSRKHHGGDSQALYAVAREELDWWGRELGLDDPLTDGWFGENLTVSGYDVDAAVLGERWRVGTALLEVTAPRIPCATFAGQMGRLGHRRGWIKRFAARGRTGAYLSVLEPGVVRAGDALEVVSRPDHGASVPDLFRALMGDRDLARRIYDLEVCVPREQDGLAKVLAA